MLGLCYFMEQVKLGGWSAHSAPECCV